VSFGVFLSSSTKDDTDGSSEWLFSFGVSVSDSLETLKFIEALLRILHKALLHVFSLSVFSSLLIVWHR